MAKGKVLVLGGTGAIGIYLVRLLSDSGYEVDVTSRRQHAGSQGGCINYLQGDAKQDGFLHRLIAEKTYDIIIDFMVYSTQEFSQRYQYLLSHTRRYVFLSSYRVFANSPVIVEDSPRLLDVCQNEAYLETDEYALAKARCEDLLNNGNATNYTIVRPSITYSKNRLQLCTLECDHWLWRVIRGKAIPLCDEMLEKETTLTWAGDAARFIAMLADNDQAQGQTYNVTTSEHMKWRDVLAIYQKALDKPIRVQYVSLSDYISTSARWQCLYDRMYDRVLDNAKVLRTTGMEQGQLIPIAKGLERELVSYPLKKAKSHEGNYQGNADRVLHSFTNPFVFTSMRESAKYIIRRFGLL